MDRVALTQEIAVDILSRAKAKGATQGDVLIADSESFFVTIRLGEVEKISQAQEKRLGLRLFFGCSSATASTSDISKESIDRLIDSTCAMARTTAKDEFSGLPASNEMVKSLPDLDLMDNDTRSLNVEKKIRLAYDAEKTALDFDPRISNSEGAEFSSSLSRVVYSNSHGFSGEYQGSIFNLSVIPIGKLNDSMQRDFWYSTQRKLSMLDPPQVVGEKAARRVLQRLGARKVRTKEVPVVFDPETAGSLLRNLSRAISGYSLYKGASFLLGKIGEHIASPLVTVIDDGIITTALGSKPFDGEGVPTRKKVIVEEGVLKSYLLDTYSGRKLGYLSTGNASRSVGAPPGVAPTNFYLSAGQFSPEQIIESVVDGFYVTELIGFGVNLVTGDYSRGAAGIWIEKGRLSYPVEEVTIAGNLKEMLTQIEMVGNDIEMRDRISSPTIKVSHMTVAGD